MRRYSSTRESLRWNANKPEVVRSSHGDGYNEPGRNYQATHRCMERPRVRSVGDKTYQIWNREKIRKFRSLLLGWYDGHKRALPWRSHPAPYNVWISEIMLQQTQVRTVLPYYERFVRRFPDVDALAAASEQEVLAAWAGLGYYRRARNLRLAARKIRKEFDGNFPESPELIRQLPGIGRYTAHAILSIAFNRPEPVVDGNVRRVITRLHGMTQRAPESFFWDQAAAWMSQERPADFNQAVMELGALICISGRPRCEICPVDKLCGARKAGIQQSVPSARRRLEATRHELVVLVIVRRGKYLLRRLPRHGFIPGMWGFPVCEVVSAAEADRVARRLGDRLTGRSAPLRSCGCISHAILHRRIRAHVFRADLDGGEPDPSWAAPSEFAALVTSSLFYKALRAAGHEDAKAARFL